MCCDKTLLRFAKCNDCKLNTKRKEKKKKEEYRAEMNSGGVNSERLKL